MTSVVGSTVREIGSHPLWSRDFELVRNLAVGIAQVTLRAATAGRCDWRTKCAE